MNKEHFLIELKIYLRPLSDEKQLSFLNKYEKIFDEQIAQGKSEELIAKELGKPVEIAEQILEEFDVPVFQKNLNKTGWHETQADFTAENYQNFSEYKTTYQPTHSSGIGHLFKIIALLFFNLCFGIWMIFTFFILLISGWIVAISFIFSPVMVAFQFFLTYYSAAMFQLFASVCLFGLGVIGILILIPCSKLFFKGLKQYFLWTIRVLKGEV